MEPPCTAFRCNSAGTLENQMVLSSSPTQCLTATSPTQLEGDGPCCGVGTSAPFVMVDATCPCRPSGTCLDIPQHPVSALAFQPQRLAVSDTSPNYGTGLCGLAAPAFPSEPTGIFTLSGHPAAESFFTGPIPGFDAKESLETSWRFMPYTSFYYPYDVAGYSFAAGYGMDFNGSRRKNATRETTSTLKAWLNEHRKNPYPTKGEKIMLAIITKMTLTQVSTWFANARRRLKKENKMTWEPRNLCDEDCEADSCSDHEDSDAEKSAKHSVLGIPDKSVISDKAGPLSSVSKKGDSLQKDTKTSSTISSDADKSDTNLKRRIWSIVDMTTSKTTESPNDSSYPRQGYSDAMNLDSRTHLDLRQSFVASRWPMTPSLSVSNPAFPPTTSATLDSRGMSCVLSDSVAVASSLARLKNAAKTNNSSSFTPIRKSSNQAQTSSSESSTVQTSREKTSLKTI